MAISDRRKPGPKPKPAEDYLWARIDADDAADVEGCWPWQGGMFDSGYGRASRHSRGLRAHRFAYEVLVGPIGDWQLDHICRNKRCVNPWHLEKVDAEDHA
ncbi:MAG: HNH endonuclease, partial [Acidobacteriota bacterium]|nr:HNH endonuclease [Acidobacteriota bacterium]